VRIHKGKIYFSYCDIQLPAMNMPLPKLVERVPLVEPIGRSGDDIIIVPNFYQKHFLGYQTSFKRKEGIYYLQLVKLNWFTRCWTWLIDLGKRHVE
jgi:hypothetical protein